MLERRTRLGRENNLENRFWNQDCQQKRISTEINVDCNSWTLLSGVQSLIIAERVPLDLKPQEYHL